MSGHSKWSSIKHKKGAVDAKRGKLFSKINRAILAAARNGGGDPDKNIELRNALLKAKEGNMPKDTVERAIKKGTGDVDGVVYKTVVYEAYAPCGVALVIDTLTDNNNRITSDIRHILDKSGGSLGTSGCVAYMFKRKGMIYIPVAGNTEDALMEIVLDAGADDLVQVEDKFEVKCPPEAFDAVRKALETAGIAIESSELTMLADTEIPVTSVVEARKILRIIDELEELDDVQAVHANFDIPESVLKELGDN